MDSGVWWATSMESQESQIQLHTKQRQQLLSYQIIYEFISEWKHWNFVICDIDILKCKIHDLET